MSSKKAIAAAIILAQAGVDYSPKTGATCPCCKAENLRVRNTLAWSGNMRIRFHLCTTPSCLLAVLKQGIKSVEMDREPEPQANAGGACARA
ncbi:MAG: transcriptional regulator [Proteobacteria bacterium]|nr:transcriptional regulator [Pseudomonadota bacterium]